MTSSKERGCRQPRGVLGSQGVQIAVQHNKWSKQMKITVMGASGRIGTRLVEDLPQAGIEVVSASPSLTGVDSVMGEGLRSAISGADVVIDVTTPRHLATAPRWRFSRPPPGICWRLPRMQASATISPFQWWERLALSKAIISTPRWCRKISSGQRGGTIPSSIPRNSSSSSAAWSIWRRMETASGFPRRPYSP